MENEASNHPEREIVPGLFRRGGGMSSTAARTQSTWLPPLTVGVYGITVVCGLLDAASFRRPLPGDRDSRVRDGPPERPYAPLGDPDLATNLMTLTFTGPHADSTLAGGDNPRALRRSVSIVIFTIGATVGAFMTRYGILWPLLAAFTVFVLALPILLQPRDEAVEGR